jgi:hypothetical protein
MALSLDSNYDPNNDEPHFQPGITDYTGEEVVERVDCLLALIEGTVSKPCITPKLGLSILRLHDQKEIVSKIPEQNNLSELTNNSKANKKRRLFDPRGGFWGLGVFWSAGRCFGGSAMSAA